MLGKEEKLSFTGLLEKIKLDESLLGEPERCWTKKNGEGAFKAQVFGISNIKDEEERKSALFDFSKEVYSFSDEKNERKRKDLYKYIGISVSVITIEGSLFTAILLTKRANSLADIRVLLEVGLYVSMIVSILAGVFLSSNIWITSQAIDDNNIQVLETRLGGHIGYVNLVIKEHLHEQSSSYKLSLIQSGKSTVVENDDNLPPPPSLSFEEKNTPIWADGVVQSIPNDCRSRS